MADDQPNLIPKLNAALAGRYAISRELGRGGMATVYLAMDPKHGREVAIKVLHPELSATLGGDRFEREIRLAAKLQHPHILGLFDSGSADGLLYYVMPFVKGESLADRIAREGMLPIEDALQITLEVNDALGYAHAQGVVHRDIKPENILLSGGHALVADFGIARAISEGGTQKLTQTGMSMGTAAYMAPEQASGEAVGPSADLYSLACVLYEMLAGEPPFTGKNSMQLMAKHAMEQVPSIRILRSVVPEDIEQAIFIALNKVPADRPQNAEQFAQLLGAPMGSTASMRVLTPTMQRRVPSGAQPVIATMKARPWWQRPAVIAAAALVVAGALTTWKLTSGSGKERLAAGPDARRLAVLYFTDLSKDSSLGPLADGLTEGLIRSLGTVQTLTVISRSGVEPFRRTSLAPDSVGRALRVGYLVRGEVEPNGDQVRVTVRLDEASGVNIERTSFVTPAASQLAMRDTLTSVVSDLIRRQLREEIQVRAQRASTNSPGAWLLLQRAEQSRKNAEALRSQGDAPGFDGKLAEADSLLTLAETEDDRWSEPATLRAAIAYRRSRVTGDLAQIREWTGVAEGHASRALVLDERDADALEVRGNAKYWRWLRGLETDGAKAKALLLSAQADLEQATTVNPNQAGAFASLSHLYYQVGSATDINIAAQRALDADEFLSNADVILNRLFLSSYDLAQFDKAAQRCAELRRRYPAGLNSVRCQLFMLTAKTQGADVALAWKLADSAVALQPPGSPARESQRLNVNMLVAGVIARASKDTPALADSARRQAKRSEGSAAIDAVRDLAWSGAFVYTLLGDTADAIRLLKEYVAANPQRAQSLRDEPGWWFRDLESDPRFRQLVGPRS